MQLTLGYYYFDNILQIEERSFQSLIVLIF